MMMPPPRLVWYCTTMATTVRTLEPRMRCLRSLPFSRTKDSSSTVLRDGDGRKRNYSSENIQEPGVWYRLLYFNTRGAAEPIRYLLAIYDIPYQDVRYPIQASSKGFGVDCTYLKHQGEGRFRANLDRVPILQVVQQVPYQVRGSTSSTSQDRVQENVLAEVGQTHAILRFLDQQHGNAIKNPLHRASVDAFVEHVRDVKSAWYKAKRNVDSREAFLDKALPNWCQKLEKSLPKSYSQSTNASPWLTGDELSLADIALYVLLATPTSIMTGSSQSFFDGASTERVQRCYSTCPHLRQSVAAMGNLAAVRLWEDRRPDTFN